jgi:hypothetical protein
MHAAAAGQAGALMIQQNSGAFVQADTAVFNQDASCEDVDAVFFDANNDGKVDLYVVSGGNQLTGNNNALLDRLYLNDGKGRFNKSTEAIPHIFENKSCASITDFDKDGDIDIFVGTLANAKAYGVPQTSYLLINDGKGHYSIAGENIISLSKIGIVTSAAFGDINKDGWNDLVIGGEWMPITIFINTRGTFKPATVPNSSGMWQTIYIDDANGDGHSDILAGNWGWNNKFHSGKNGPAKLYVSDFDKNGQTDQLLSYTLNGEEYPFLAKDEVERVLPLLKKHYLLYSEYAGVVMKDVFYGWIDTIQPIKCERLGSAVCYGDGKGSFTISDLPAHLQMSPVFSFAKIAADQVKGNMYVSGGNFFDVIPYEGRYDAQPLALLRSDNNKTIKSVLQPDLLQLKAQVRDVKLLRTAKHGNVLVVASNNDMLKFYSTFK